MAIVFETLTPEVNLRMAYNNDVIRYYSDDSLNPAEYSDILFLLPGVFDPAVTLRLYPAPDGKFYINLKAYASALLNTKGFADDLVTDIGGIDPDAYIYDHTEGTVMTASVEVSIQSFHNFLSLMWLAGAEQLADYNTFLKSGFYILSPCNKLTDNHYKLKYWQGYPFDIAMFFGQGTITKEFTILNKTNTLDFSFEINQAGGFNQAGRLIFSDGRTDETLEDLLPLVDGHNELVWYKTEPDEAAAKTIIVEKVPYKCGVYMKWMNKYGGYSYWLFEHTYAIDRSSKSLGEMDRDNDNFKDSTGRTVQLGQTTQDSIRVIAELLKPDERRIVEGILDSPKVYLFTGQPLARNSFNNWQEVSLKTNNARIKNPKQTDTNFVFDFELPTRYTQTL